MLRFAQQKEREGAGIPGGCSSPAKGWAKTRQMAPPLAQSSPPGKEEQGGESPGEGKMLNRGRRVRRGKMPWQSARSGVAGSRSRLGKKGRESGGEKPKKSKASAGGKKLGKRIRPEKNKEQNSWGRKIGGLFFRARLVSKIFWEKYCSNFQPKIRRTKYDLIVNLITRMDGKSRDESIKPN